MEQRKDHIEAGAVSWHVLTVTPRTMLHDLRNEGWKNNLRKLGLYRGYNISMILDGL